MTVVVSRGIPSPVTQGAESEVWSTGGVWPYLPGLEELSDQKRRLASAVMDPEVVYRSQEAVRKVVDYLCAKFSRVPMHGYLRESITERLALADNDPLRGVLSEPRAGVPQSRFLPELLRDRLLWDRWCCLPLFVDGRDQLLRLPPRLWDPIVDRFDQVTGIRFQGRVTIPAERLFMWYGRAGGEMTPMRAIQESLLELIVGAEYRSQIFARGGRFPAYIHRPPAGPPPAPPEWDTDDSVRFMKDFRAQWAGGGPSAGGLPMLEDGMEIRTVDVVKPSDAQYLEGVQMGEIKVCSFYHLAPELLGLRTSNYASQDSYRESLYRETLGVYFTSFQDEWNVQYVPAVSPDNRAYVEFLLEAALAGSFLEQASAMQSSVGAPWLLRSEARAKFNLEPIEDADQLITPLNVLTGALASPRDAAPEPNQLPPLPEKAAKAQSEGEKARALFDDALVGFFVAQAGTIRDQLGLKATLEWDTEKWDDELSRLIIKYTPLIASAGAKGVLSKLDPEYAWSDEPMLRYLHTGALRIAQNTNQNTQKQLLSALASDDWEAKADAILAGAPARGARLAGDISRSAHGFGQMEAGKAVGAKFKKWVVHAVNPRASHSLQNGLVIPVGAPFPNGCKYPGDHAGGPDETTGCTCSLEIVRG